MKHTISILVENHAGVLSRVSGLFSRRGFNIDSLAVGVTADPSVSRITIVADGDEYMVEQLEKQIEELIANGGSIISLAEITVSGITTKSYTGEPVTQNITLKVDENILEEGTDYEVVYADNVNVGVATMTIKGIGKFRGTLKRTFKINPKATKMRKVTGKSRGFTAYWYKQSNQTTGYQIQYSLYKSFKSPKTLTIKGTAATSKSVSKLKKKKYYYVRVRTYMTVGSTNYYSSWSSYKSVKTK